MFVEFVKKSYNDEKYLSIIGFDDDEELSFEMRDSYDGIKHYTVQEGQIHKNKSFFKLYLDGEIDNFDCYQEDDSWYTDVDLDQAIYLIKNNPRVICISEITNRVGYWKFWSDRDGYLIKEGQYSQEGKPEGIWKYYYNKQSTVREIRNYKTQLKEIHVQIFNENGNLQIENIRKIPNYDLNYEGEPYHGSENEKLNFYNNRYEYYSGEIKNYYVNGKIHNIGQYEEGKKYGEFLFFCPDGSKEIIEFDNDHPTNGTMIKKVIGELNENYAIVKETYKNGKLVGPEKTYYKNGAVRGVFEYRNGEKHGLLQLFYDSGQIMIEKQLNEGIDNGPYKSYYENGQLKIDSANKEGKWHGPYKSYYENGQLEIDSANIDDEWNGLFCKYDENGNLVKKKIYKDGEVTKNFNVNHEVTKPKIIELLESRPNDKLSDEDVNRFLKYGNEQQIKEMCDELYYDSLIQREGKTDQWHRYYCITKKKATEKKKNEGNKVDQPTQADEGSNQSDPISELRKFKALLDEGLIDQSDYEEKKNELLGLENDNIENTKEEVKVEPVNEEAKKETSAAGPNNDKTTRRFKGNFGELTLTISPDNSCIGYYPKAGELKGTFVNEEFNGQWKNAGMEGLLIFRIENGVLIGRWKKGLEEGKMKGKWKGEEI